MNNKLQLAYSAAAFFLVTTLSSCELVTGIFKGGMYFGIILVVLVIGLIIWLLTRLGGGRRN